MTTAAPDAAPDATGAGGRAAIHGWLRDGLARPLPWLLLLAAVLRIGAALTAGFHHPDAIYQYLEPAHRLTSGDGVITWEWRSGIRSWLLPTLLAAPLALGEAIDGGGPLAMLLPRLATAAASLGIVWAAWTIGRRHAMATGALAAFVTATWFELVYFAAETLAEPVAVAAILPATAIATAPHVGVRRAAIVGMLLGFAVLARPHYAPACAAMILVAWWPGLSADAARRGRWPALAAGAAAVAAACAGIDALHGQTPFAWIAENVRQNVVHNVAARYGTFPLLTYAAWFMELWRWWLIPVIVGVRFGWRQCPALLALAAVTVAVHSVIPHKEYRFILLAVASLILLAAMGWGEIIRLARVRWGAAAARATGLAVFAGWAAASIVLAHGELAPNQQTTNTAGARLFAAMRRDAAVCGVALIKPASFANVPGTVGLRPGIPLSMFWTGDPATTEDPWRTASRWGATFNRIVTAQATGQRPSPPAGYRVDRCESSGTASVCVLARAGACAGGVRSPFAINRVLARTGF